MKRPAIILLTLTLGAVAWAHRAADVPTTEPATTPASAAARFAAIDVYLDSGAQPLAVYQFELKVIAGDVTLVGIEGGEHRAFRPPPYYDPAALNGRRIVVAGFDTGTDLPRGRTRVARLMVRVRGGVAPKYDAIVQAAAGIEGTPIAASISVSQAPANSEGAGR